MFCKKIKEPRPERALNHVNSEQSLFLGPCRLAVEEYRLAHGIDEEIRIIDSCSAYWRKTVEE